MNETLKSPKEFFDAAQGQKKDGWTKAIGKNENGEFAVVETQRANYTDKEARDAHISRLKEAGMKHVNKFTTHEGNDPKIIYVVTWAEPAPLTVTEGK